MNISPNNTNNNYSNAIFSGCITALITPFTESGEVDYDSFKNLLEFQYKRGIRAVVIAGTTGEAPTIEESEYRSLIALAKEFKPELKVIGGKSSNSTKKAIELAQIAEEAGADGIMCVTPYYNKPSQEGLYNHFNRISTSANLPIMLYDVPGRTGISLDLQTTEALSQLANITALKDATGDLTRPLKLRGQLADNFKLLSGEDPTNLAFLAHGGDGAVSVSSNIMPELCARQYSRWISGDIKQAREASMKLISINQAMTVAPSPAPAKYVLKQLGIIENDYTRAPMEPLLEEEKSTVRKLVSNYLKI
jgi:4-hydroxy-tetrahydrodipicolinate synthase